MVSQRYHTIFDEKQQTIPLSPLRNFSIYQNYHGRWEPYKIPCYTSDRREIYDGIPRVFYFVWRFAENLDSITEFTDIMNVNSSFPKKLLKKFICDFSISKFSARYHNRCSSSI